MTDNISVSQITEDEYYKCHKRTRKFCRTFIDGKKQSPEMDYLISSNTIKNRIEEIWGKDYASDDLFGWGYYELGANTSKFKYLVIVDEPINPIAYLLDKDMQVDSITIMGAGVLTSDNIYFTEELYDCDESVHLNWYLITGDQVKRMSEFKETSFEYQIIFDLRLPGCFAGNKGHYYCAIENKLTQQRCYYKISIAQGTLMISGGILKPT